MESLIVDLLIYLIDNYLDCVDSLANLKLVNKHYKTTIESKSKFNQFIRDCFIQKEVKLTYRDGELIIEVPCQFKIESINYINLSRSDYKEIQIRLGLNSDIHGLLMRSNVKFKLEFNKGLALVTTLRDLQAWFKVDKENHWQRSWMNRFYNKLINKVYFVYF